MPTLDGIVVTEPKQKRTFTYNEEDIKAIAKEGFYHDAKSEGIKVFEDIKDKDGHMRFLEGEIDLLDTLPAGIEKIYGKWSLSGSHLLFVICYSIANTTVSSFGTITKNIDLPQWIKDKIVPIASQTVDLKSILFYGSDLSTQGSTAYLVKSSNNVYINVGSITANADRQVRIAFDLLIDNE